MRRYAIASIVLGLAFVLPACGSDDETLTKDEFVKQGNAICKSGNAEIDKAAETAFTGDAEPKPEELEAFVTGTLVPNVRKQVADLRALDEPKDDEDTINGILDDADDVLDSIEDDPAKFANADADPFADVFKRAEAYGLTECGDSGN